MKHALEECDPSSKDDVGALPRRIVLLRVQASRPYALTVLRVTAGSNASEEAVVLAVKSRVAELEELRRVLNPSE